MKNQSIGAFKTPNVFHRCVVTKDGLFPDYKTGEGSMKPFFSVLNQLLLGGISSNELILETCSLNEVREDSVTVFTIGREGLDMGSYTLSLSGFLNGENVNDEGFMSLHNALVIKELPLIDGLIVEQLLIAWLDLRNGIFIMLDGEVQDKLFSHLCAQQAESKKRWKEIIV